MLQHLRVPLGTLWHGLYFRFLNLCLCSTKRGGRKENTCGVVQCLSDESSKPVVSKLFGGTLLFNFGVMDRVVSQIFGISLALVGLIVLAYGMVKGIRTD